MKAFATTKRGLTAAVGIMSFTLTAANDITVRWSSVGGHSLVVSASRERHTALSSYV